MSTPRRMNTRAAQLALPSSNPSSIFDNESDSLASNSPFRKVNVLDKRFDKLSSTLTATLTKLIKSEIIQCEQRIIKEVDINKQIKQLLKESEGSLLHQLEVKLCEKITEMRLEIEHLTERIQKLEHEANQTKTTLQNKVEELKNDIANVSEKAFNINTQPSETFNLQSEFLSFRKKLLQQENFAVACDLRIDGVPYTNGENLNVLFSTMCSNLNIATPNIRAIYRIKRKYNNKSSAPTIIVKLMTPFDKNFILRTVSNYRRSNKDLLRIFLFNFEANNPFYVNESLSETNYKIFNSAFKMKREKLLSSVFTTRGIVHVTINQGDQPIRIEYLEQLNSLFRHDGSGQATEQEVNMV